MPTEYTLAEGSWRGARCDSDVFVVVKEYISSNELRQAPLLVLPAPKAYPLVPQGHELMLNSCLLFFEENCLLLFVCFGRIAFWVMPLPSFSIFVKAQI